MTPYVEPWRSELWAIELSKTLNCDINDISEDDRSWATNFTSFLCCHFPSGNELAIRCQYGVNPNPEDILIAAIKLIPSNAADWERFVVNTLSEWLWYGIPDGTFPEIEKYNDALDAESVRRFNENRNKSESERKSAYELYSAERKARRSADAKSLPIQRDKTTLQRYHYSAKAHHSSLFMSSNSGDFHKEAYRAHSEALTELEIIAAAKYGDEIIQSVVYEKLAETAAQKSHFANNTVQL